MRQLLKKASVRRLDFLKLVLMKNRISVQELIELGDFSRATVRRMYTELNEDFYDAFGNRQTILRQENNNVYSVISDLSPSRLFHTMKLHYLNQTPQYNILFEIATARKEWHAEALGQKFDISSSYLYQIIREVNQVISGYQVEISRNGADELYLSGEEKNIRLLIFSLIFNAYQGLEIPISSKNRKVVSFIQSLELSPSEKSQMLLIFSIIELRLQQGKVVEPMSQVSSEILEMLQVRVEIIEFQTGFLEEFLSDQATIDTEILYLRLMIRILVYRYESDNQKVLLGKQFTMMEENDLAAFSKEVFWNLLGSYGFHLEERSYYQSIFFVVLLHVFLEVFPLNFDEILVLNFSHESVDEVVEEEQILAIKEFYNRCLIESYPKLAKRFKKEQRLYMASQLYTLLKLPKAEAVKIFIHYSQNFLGELLVRKRLSQMFNEDTLKITADVKEADVIISDSIEDDRDQSKYFFFYDATNKFVWRNLYRFLQKQAMRKMFQDGDTCRFDPLYLPGNSERSTFNS